MTGVFLSACATRGYGWVQTSAGDVFVHAQSMLDRAIPFDNRTLAGRRCRFDKIRGPKGAAGIRVELLDQPTRKEI